MSSSSTTPKEYTSDLSVNFPLDAYSGAKYLNLNHGRILDRVSSLNNNKNNANASTDQINWCYTKMIRELVCKAAKNNTQMFP